MAEVDPVSGLPKITVERELKFTRLEVQKAKADELASEVASEKGQMILNKIEEHLLNRVNFLIENDPECKALKKVLLDLGITLNVGEMATKKLMQLVIKKQ